MIVWQTRISLSDSNIAKRVAGFNRNRVQNPVGVLGVRKVKTATGQLMTEMPSNQSRNILRMKWSIGWQTRISVSDDQNAKIVVKIALNESGRNMAQVRDR
jgi:hypothetical protein